MAWAAPRPRAGRRGPGPHGWGCGRRPPCPPGQRPRSVRVARVGKRAGGLLAASPGGGTRAGGARGLGPQLGPREAPASGEGPCCVPRGWLAAQAASALPGTGVFVTEQNRAPGRVPWARVAAQPSQDRLECPAREANPSAAWESAGACPALWPGAGQDGAAETEAGFPGRPGSSQGQPPGAGDGGCPGWHRARAGRGQQPQGQSKVAGLAARCHEAAGSWVTWG